MASARMVHGLTLRRFAGLLAVAAAALPASAGAQAVTFGSPLTSPPNLGEFIRCENRISWDASSGNAFVVPSGAPDCTWRQQGVFGNINDPRHSSVPGDGRIIGVEVLSGNNPAPLTFVVMSQYVSESNTGNTSCCHFVAETSVAVQPQPNTRTAFPLDLAVQRNTVGDLRRFDLVGVSAAAGTGMLPLHSTGQNNLFSYTQTGSVNAGEFYPRVSAASGLNARHEDGVAGVEVLARWTWCPAGQTCGVGGGGGGSGGGGGTGGGGGGTGGGGTGGASAAPTLASRNAALAAGRALIDLACGGDAACAGVLELFNRGGAPVAKRKPTMYGSASYEIAAGGETTVRIKLNRKAKKQLRKKDKLKADLTITPTGGPMAVTPVTIKPKP
jgi:hypothetical protein